MTVGELIEALQSYDPDTEVTVHDFEYEDDVPLNEIFSYDRTVVLSA